MRAKTFFLIAVWLLFGFISLEMFRLGIRDISFGLMVTGFILLSLKIVNTFMKGTTVGQHKVRGKESSLVVSRRRVIKGEVQYRHVGIIGPTGAGKSTSFYLPNIVRKADERCSIVVTDPKGELYRYTSRILERNGKEVYIINPLDLRKSHFYNPLEFLEKYHEYLDLARVMIENGSQASDKEWVNLSAPLFTSALLYASTRQGVERSIPYALHLIANYPNEKLREILGGNEKSRMAWRAFESSLGSERTASSIRATILNSLAFYFDPEIGTFLSRNDIPIDKLRDKEIAIFVQIPESESEKFYPITAVFYDQVFSIIYKKDNLPVYVFTDELANIGKIPDLGKYASTLRSRRGCIAYGLQGISQLIERYGREEAYSILNNTHTKIVLSGTGDPETLKYFTQLAGRRRVIRTSKHRKPLSWKKSYTDRLEEVPVLTEEELRVLGEWEIYLFFSNKPPIKDEKPYVDLSEFARIEPEDFNFTKLINFSSFFEEGSNHDEGEGEQDLSILEE